MLDILMCSIPSVEIYLPPAAPATLKGYLNQQGFTSKCIDLNLMMYQSKPDAFGNLSAYFSYESNQLSDEIKQDWEDVITEWVSAITTEDFKWLGLSVFTVNSVRAVLDICNQFKNRDFKIVVGGMGLTPELCNHLMENNLIDAYIMGEGEHALVNLLKDNIDFPGINSPGVQIADLDELGFTDYDDYNLERYTGFYNEPVVQITGSRGCVRRCTFCNINDHWPKFKFRSGQHIAQEIIQTYERKGIKNFYFTDSLINGSMSAYMKMCEKLSFYNEQHNANITWGGQYIVRSAKELPTDYYSLTASSGATNLAMGIETGSDVVRAHMQKKFSNQDLDLTMENFAKHQITCSYLLIVGYPIETEEDFYETLRMLQRHQQYAAQGIILGVSLGTTMLALEGSPVFKSFGNDILVEHKKMASTWILKSNPELNYAVRVKRRLQAELLADYLGYNTISSDRNFANMMKELDVLHP
jgi:hypothetical protein